MAVTVKSEKQIALMREAGRLLAITHEELHKALKPGMTTLDIDRLGEEIIRDFGCVPNFKNYNGFPASICVSINDEVVHGIPTDKRVLKEGEYRQSGCRAHLQRLSFRCSQNMGSRRNQCRSTETDRRNQRKLF